MSNQQIVQLVEQYLQKHQYDNIHIAVLPQSVYQDGNWWYVPVRPDHSLPKTYRYYEELTEVETEIKENENIDVLLVPAA